MITSWIPVSEKRPADKVVVIVGQDAPQIGSTTNFAGWLVNGKWFSFAPNEGLRDRGEMRATDWWLPIPEWPAGSGVVNGGWPA